MEKQDCLNVGKVARLHGYKGELSLKLDHDLPFEYDEIEAFYLDQNNKLVPYFVSSMKFTPKGYALTFLEGVDSEERAKRLIGTGLYLSKADLPELDEGEYFTHELVGFLVTDNNYGDLGRVLEILEYPGNNQLRIEHIDGEVLIPLIDEFVIEVDKKSSLIKVETPEGLINLNLDNLD